MDRLLTNHGLPFAGSASIASQQEVRLKTHFTLCWKRGFDFTSIVLKSWETRSLQQNFDENLSIESERGRVERHCLNGRVDVIRSSDAVGCEKVDKLLSSETCVCHAVQNHCYWVLGLRNGTNASRESGIGTTSQELKARSTRTVRYTDCASKLNEIAGTDQMPLQERR